MQRIAVAEGVLVQRNLVDHKYQQKSKVLYAKKIFSENISCAYVLNVEASNSVFWKTNNTEFDEIVMTFIDQMGHLLIKSLAVRNRR